MLTLEREKLYWVEYDRQLHGWAVYYNGEFEAVCDTKRAAHAFGHLLKYGMSRYDERMFIYGKTDTGTCT